MKKKWKILINLLQTHTQNYTNLQPHLNRALNSFGDKVT